MKKLLTRYGRAVFAFILFTCCARGICQNTYTTYGEMTRTVKDLVSSHKDIAKVQSIARTSEGRDVWAVTVGAPDADSTHAVLIVGGAEGDRLIGSELAVRFLKFLVEGYGTVDSITNLVRSTTFYILPRVSPDASEGFFAKPLWTRTVNSRAIDDDRDGAVDEDGFEDMNNDGLITMMRVKDPRGEWMPHPDDPRVMKKADPAKGEQGIYRLYSEGIDNDKDEQWNEDPPGGVDFNRNFPFNYAYFGKGSGPNQLSEPETKGVADFAFAHPNITVVFTFSSNDNLMNPWKKESGGPRGQQAATAGGRGGGGGRRRFVTSEDDQSSRTITSMMDEDEQYFTFISKKYQDITRFKGAPASTKGEGAFSEWAYYHFGRWSFAANPWWVPEMETKKDSSAPDTTRRRRPEDRRPGRGGPQAAAAEEKADEYADQIKALKWMDANGIRDGFVPWKKVSHPDFPENEVEIGGFRPYVLTNPPPDSIEAIAAKENSFLAWLGAKLPSVSIGKPKVEAVDGKVFRLTLDVVNNGYLPTNSAMGSRSRWPREVHVVLSLSKGQTLASGKAKMLLPAVRGSGGRQELSWLIVSPPGEAVTLIAESPTSGRASETITLK